MKTYFLVTYLTVFTILLTACRPSSSPQTQPAPQGTVLVEDRGPVIVMRRSGGFDGRTLEWQIFANGLVVSKGGQSPDVVSQAPVQAVSELVAWLEGSGFLTADFPTPNPDETCCDRFLYELTVNANSRSNTVVVLDSPENLPGDLAEAFRRVAALLKVSL